MGKGASVRFPLRDVEEWRQSGEELPGRPAAGLGGLHGGLEARWLQLASWDEGILPKV